MERKIGEIFEYNGEWYQCVEGNTCNDCAFYRSSCGSLNCKGSCRYNFREDATNVIFKKLEKIGKPYEHYEKFYQCYKLPMETEIRLLPNNCYPIGKDNLVEIEIKQKEDMEEKKLNLKPFDIQKAKEGKPVYTRDGRKTRIIAFDANGGRPIVALVTECDDEEEIPYKYHCDGFYNCQSIPSDNDLMMLPEKKEGWVNVYKRENEYICENECNVFTGIAVYKSEGEAKRNIDKNEIYVNTIKITWEE